MRIASLFTRSRLAKEHSTLMEDYANLMKFIDPELDPDRHTSQLAQDRLFNKLEDRYQQGWRDGYAACAKDHMRSIQRRLL